jgi:prophage regulatory protein
MIDTTHERPTLGSDMPAFLRLPAVIRITGLGRTTIYRMVADKKFPRPVPLGVRAIAWRTADVEQWSNARPPTTH